MCRAITFVYLLSYPTQPVSFVHCLRGVDHHVVGSMLSSFAFHTHTTRAAQLAVNSIRRVRGTTGGTLSRRHRFEATLIDVLYFDSLLAQSPVASRRALRVCAGVRT